MSIPLGLNLPLFYSQSPTVLSKPSLSLSKSHICFTSSQSNNYEREEARWLREEQRWLREEQRWLREESRWNAERESFVREIQTLKLRIQAMEQQTNVQGDLVADSVGNIAKLLQALMKEEEVRKKENQISESGSSALPLVVEAVKKVEAVEQVEEVVVREVIGGLGEKGTEQKDGNEMMKRRVTLRKGSEGEEVRAMQEALLKLGFYSGEEDMEFSSFSSGTERAVKTWQATFGAAEDGVMTAELLERLLMEQNVGDSGVTVYADPKGNDAINPQKGDLNGAAGASITEIQQKVVNDGSVTEVEVSERRVFLLGENRWEDPSRLAGKKKDVSSANSRGVTTKCLACRGEGRLLCTECDGTGEPNIEPQFMEWIDEGAKCPYCEGLGYTICDVCEGKPLIQQ